MCYLKTLSGSKGKLCLFFSWSLFLLTPTYTFGQDSNDLTLTSANTEIGLDFQNGSDFSVAELGYDLLPNIGVENGISFLEVEICMKHPLKPQATVELLPTPGTLWNGSSNGTQTISLNNNRKVITVVIQLQSPQRFTGKTLFFLEIDNDNKDLAFTSTIHTCGGLAQIDLADPGRMAPGLDHGDFGESVSDLSIYPVPTHDEINIASRTKLDKVEVFSLDGSLVKQIDVTNSAQLTVPVSDLNNGFYLLRTIDEYGRAYQEKFNVQHY